MSSLLNTIPMIFSFPIVLTRSETISRDVRPYSITRRTPSTCRDNALDSAVSFGGGESITTKRSLYRYFYFLKKSGHLLGRYQLRWIVSGVSCWQNTQLIYFCFKKQGRKPVFLLISDHSVPAHRENRIVYECRAYEYHSQ